MHTKHAFVGVVLSVRVVHNNNGRRIRDDEGEDKIEVEYYFLDLVGPGDNPPALLGLGVDRCVDEMHRRRRSFGSTVFGAKQYHEHDDDYE